MEKEIKVLLTALCLMGVQLFKVYDEECCSFGDVLVCDSLFLTILNYIDFARFLNNN